MQGGFLVAEVPVNQDRHADARLIAAAPELLNALRELQANPNDPRAHRVAFGAIAKATGESA
ncbi:hypothetical protein C7389_11257 [Azoarcus indigens]|uniref:Uncharacterized protein n=2 Tax=Azoarcus indigens TaxID=29545 RepID=A0A4R6DVD6_9RHOO|nr:hypothetical protein C7389_11257 [Azoarcus indigens]